VEGIYQYSGDLAPLDEIYKLKQEYKYRLVVDETVSFGVLGEKGRGACEHFGLQPGDVEIVAASMGTSLATIGGFCAGAREMVDHQRLSGLGYCFSASLPPFLATAAIGALEHMQQHPESLQQVRQNAQTMRGMLQKIPQLKVFGDECDNVSPVIHLHLAQPPEDAVATTALLQKVVDECLDREGVFFTVNRLSELDKSKQPPSIRVAVTAKHQQKDLQKAADALKAASRRILGRGRG
jgi:serine palmitoyltransferase